MHYYMLRQKLAKFKTTVYSPWRQVITDDDDDNDDDDDDNDDDDDGGGGDDNDDDDDDDDDDGGDDEDDDVKLSKILLFHTQLQYVCNCCNTDTSAPIFLQNMQCLMVKV